MRCVPDVASLPERVDLFVQEIERQMGWVTQAQWASLPLDMRRLDFVRLQRQVQAITEFMYLDKDGREQLYVSRIGMDSIGSNTDRSAEAAFVGAKANKVWFGPVYFRKDSEPYLTIAIAHGGNSGVTIATGVDLGQANPQQIDDWAIDEALKTRLKPYCGLKRQQAVDFLRKRFARAIWRVLHAGRSQDDDAAFSGFVCTPQDRTGRSLS